MTVPSLSPANPEPKIYLALSHDDFVSVSPAIFRSDLPPFSCRFLTCHLSRSRLHQRFTFTRKACVEVFQAHTSARARSLADRQRFVWRHLLFQPPGLQEGSPCSRLSWEGSGRFLGGGSGERGAGLRGIPVGSRFASSGKYSLSPPGGGGAARRPGRVWQERVRGRRGAAPAPKGPGRATGGGARAP